MRMSKIHITLVGGQPIPVYLGIVHSRPDKIVFIHSEQSVQEVERIRQEMEMETEAILFDPVDLKQIKESTEALAEKYAGNPVSINISSGTKPWAVFFAQSFSTHLNTELFYIDQNNVVRNFKDFSQTKLEIDMNKRFALYGNPLTQFKNIDEFSEADFQSIERIRRIRKFNFTDFNFLSDSFSKRPDQTCFETHNGSGLEWDVQKRHINLKVYNNRGDFMSEIFDSPGVRDLFTNTGWFELEVARLLSQWDKVKEVRVNCVFPTQKNSPKNEIDIIIDTGTKLLFVECKTQIQKETDIDKFASVVKVYGGMGSKALFITDAPMREKAAEKCHDNKIIPFSISEYKSSEELADALYTLLDKELYNINTK